MSTLALLFGAWKQEKSVMIGGLIQGVLLVRMQVNLTPLITYSNTYDPYDP